MLALSHRHPADGDDVGGEVATYYVYDREDVILDFARR